MFFMDACTTPRHLLEHREDVDKLSNPAQDYGGSGDAMPPSFLKPCGDYEESRQFNGNF